MSPAGEQVGQGYVGLGLEENLAAELRRVQSQVKRTMDAIDRMEATADIDAAITDFQKDALWVRQEMARLDKLEATPEVKADKKALREMRQEIDNGTAALRIQKREIQAHTKAEERQAKAVDATAKAEKARARALSQAEAQTRRMIGVQGQAIDMDRRRSIEVEKLRQSYAKMLGQQSKIARSAAFGNAFDKSRLSQLNAELDRTSHRIKELGGDTADLTEETERSRGRFGKMFSSLGAVRIQMGFLSGTLRQVATGFTILGPVVFAVAGQIAALIGVLGTGLLGAMSVGSAVASGFALSLGGIIAIAKPLVGELQDAFKASEAYGDAVRKYGKGSTEAATAQEKLNQTLKGVSPEAKAAFKDIGSLGDRWRNLTEDAGKKSFFDLVGSGVQAANKLMPMFARESTKTFNTATKSAQRWTDALSTKGARQGIAQIMSGFRESLPAINKGMLSLGTTFGRISVSASKLLPSLGSGFSDWAENLMNSIGSGGGLDATISRLVDHMRQIGQFAQSAGSMLATFFNAGANEGATLLSTLTSIFDRWDAWMSSASGQDSLSQFFSQANALGSSFVSTLASMGVALFEFSQAFAPLSQGFIVVVNGISSVTAALMGLSGARAIVTTLGGALAGAFVAGRFAAAASAIGLMVTALKALGTAGAVTSLASLANPITALGTAIGAAIAAISLIKTQSAAASDSISSLGDSIASTTSLIQGLAGADAEQAAAKLALLAAQRELTDATKDYRDIVREEGKGSDAAKDANLRRKSAIQAEQAAQTRLNQSVRETARSRREASTAATQDLRDAKELVKTIKEGQGDDLGNLFKGATSILRGKPKELIGAWKEIKDLVEGGASDAEVMAAAEKQLAAASKNVQKSWEATALSRFNALRTGRDQIDVTKKIGAAWVAVETSINKAGQVRLAKMDPKQATQAVRQTAQAIDAGLGAKANRILINPELNTKEILAKLRALTSQAQKVAIDPKVNKTKADRDLGQIGKGKTATIQTKANTKGAENSLRGLSKKQLQARLTVRANDSDAVGKLNRLERKRLQAKMVKLGADPAAAMAAIRAIEARKFKTKSVKLEGKANIGAVTDADKKIQGVKDKTVNVKTKADLSGVNAANSAIAAVPASKTSTITTVHKTVRSNAGGGSPRQDPLNSGDRVIDNAYQSARTQQNRPGKYSRPTLLVGEERKDEYVIATNPAYRSANEGYLAQAAGDLGYNLVEAAKKGKGISKSASKYGRTRTKYDYIRDNIDRLTTLSSNMSATRSANIEQGRPEGYNLEQVIAPLKTALDPWYNKLEKNIIARANASARVADRNRKALTKKGGHNDDVRRAKKALNKAKAMPKGNEDQRDARDKAVNRAERKFNAAKNKQDRAKNNVKTRGDSAGALARELAGLNNERASLKNTMQDLRDNEANRLKEGTTAGDSNPIGLQIAALDKERYDLFNSFGNNIMGAVGGGAGSPTGGFGSNGPFASQSAAPPPMPSGYGLGGSPAKAPGAGVNAPLPVLGAGGGGQQQSSGGSTVVQNNTFAEAPKDPHTFSRQMAWEVQVGVG